MTPHLTITKWKLLKPALLVLTAISIISVSSISMARTLISPAAIPYQHCGFKGYSSNLYVGRYNLHDLRRIGIRNDDLSSIRVMPGYAVTLYEHANFRGRSIRLTHSDRCFVNNGFNDIVSSIKVERIRHVDPYPPVRPVPPSHTPAHPPVYSRRVPTVYQHCGFRGYGVRLGLGWYNLRKLRRMGIRNDDLSSIRVPRGFIVTLYEHANFRGRRIRLTHSDNCFVNNGFNDIVSSIKVERIRLVHPDPRPQPPVYSGRKPMVFQHCGFGGYGVRLGLGWYNLRQLRRMGIRNDDLSSIRVPRGYVVTLYEHANFRGRRIRLTYSNRCFVNIGFNDIVSSIKVERRRYRY